MQESVYTKGFPVSWEELHRTAKALAWRLLEEPKFDGVIAITRGGLVPAAIVARELEIRVVDTLSAISYHDNSAEKLDDKQRETVQIVKAPSYTKTGKNWLIVDDLVDSGGTICNAAKALLDNGATNVYGYCSHGVYSGKALDNINNSVLEEMVCTNSIKPTFDVPKSMRYLSVAPLFGEAIMRINTETSISSLFD